MERIEMKRYLLLVASLMLIATLLAACGGGGDDDATATTVQPAVTATTAAEPTTAPGNGGGDAQAGAQLAGAQCAACHSFDGSVGVGPTWQGLYGQEIELESGETLTADDEYIHESIVEPGAKIHKGFANIMPSFGQTLSESQIQDIIAYIKTLN